MKDLDLKTLFSAPLPGEIAHLELMPERRTYLKLYDDKKQMREAAVSIILFENALGFLSTLVIKRQEYDGSHSGQFSFPGGKMEKSDHDLYETACRECREEIGVNPEQMILLKEITPVYVPVSGFVVVPYVFYSETNKFNFQKSEREVQEIFEVKLNDLFTASALKYKDVKSGSYLLKNIPHFEVNEVAIWGATALMLNEIKHILKHA